MTMTAAVLEAGRALIAEDVLDTPYLSRRLAEQLPARSLMGLPLIARDQKLGAVLLTFNEPHRFTPEEVAFCEQAVAQMALALANAMLYQVIGEERSRLGEIIEASRDGILLIGVNQRLLVCNNITLQFLGVRGRPEDWIGRTVLEALGELRRTAPNAVRATISEVRRTQEADESPGEGEFDMHGRILHWHHLPVRARGALLGRLVVMHDITEERSLERVRNDLTHMMVHDLRSPLTAIIGASDALSDTAGLTPNDRSTVELIRDGADRMLNLVNDILDVSRLESNRMPIEKQSVDMPMLIVETLQLYMGQIEKKQIRLMNDSQADLPPVHADSRLIERVIQNLLSNAIKYTPEGGALRITAAAPSAGTPMIEGPRSMLMISVSDTGPGIPPEIQRRVFEKFVRGDSKEHGSGLGLAFCRLVVEAHEGRIWVESEPGTGTTVRFTLPLVDAGPIG
jgi:signal transduction histidine kinase